MSINYIPRPWKEWVAENLLVGAEPEAIKAILLENIAGLTPQQADAEINSPEDDLYYEMCRRLTAASKKREWMLTVLDEGYRANGKYPTLIERRTLPDYQTFLNEYYHENKPAIFENAASHWPAMQWDLESLKSKLSNPEIEVQAGRSKDAEYERNGSKYKTKMKFNDFIDKILSLESSNDMYLTANNALASLQGLGPLFKEIGNLGDGYIDMDSIDKQFLWIGPKGTITPNHHDLTNNMFVQIYGKKKFWLVPSTQMHYLYSSGHVFSHVDLKNPDYEKFPLLRNATIMEFEVGPGDFLFIPIGWWHSVESTEHSISFSGVNFKDVRNDFFTLFPEGNGRY